MNTSEVTCCHSAQAPVRTKNKTSKENVSNVQHGELPLEATPDAFTLLPAPSVQEREKLSVSSLALKDLGVARDETNSQAQKLTRSVWSRDVGLLNSAKYH